MHYVSLLIEFLRGRPAVVFWTVALTQAALWTFIPALFYSAPPGDLALLLGIGHEFRLGSYLGPPLAFWLALPYNRYLLIDESRRARWWHAPYVLALDATEMAAVLRGAVRYRVLIV